MIEVIVGPMFAGKTTLLVAIAHRSLSGYSAYYPAMARWDGVRRIEARDGSWIVADPLLPGELAHDWRYESLVVLDEIQFWGADELHAFLVSVPPSRHVICAGVQSDHYQRPFPAVAVAMAVAGSVRVLRSRCACCGAFAQYTKRLAVSDDTFFVGRDADYEVRCGECWGK